jgi:hypothetical protein
MSSGDPELASAMCSLVDELRARGLATTSDPVQAHRGAQWSYVGSAPFREDDHTIIFIHIFQHACHPVTGDTVTFGIAASPAWWPDASCQTVLLPRSHPTAKLRLVC